MIWREKQAEDLHAAAVRLKTENKFRDAFVSDMASLKSKAKAGFFAALLEDRNLQGKFKDSFAWVQMPAEERAIAIACNSDASDHMAQTRGPSPKFLKFGKADNKTSGQIATKIQ